MWGPCQPSELRPRRHRHSVSKQIRTWASRIQECLPNWCYRGLALAKPTVPRMCSAILRATTKDTTSLTQYLRSRLSRTQPERLGKNNPWMCSLNKAASSKRNLSRLLQKQADDPVCHRKIMKYRIQCRKLILRSSKFRLSYKIMSKQLILSYMQWKMPYKLLKIEIQLTTKILFSGQI